MNTQEVGRAEELAVVSRFVERIFDVIKEQRLDFWRNQKW